jgi:glycosyltransferase involved in cell wall biosynthesis
MNYLEQNTGPQDEILIINDNSTDQTSLILKKWAKKNSNVSVINNSESGIASALNLGLKHASNDWIARFDVDDRYPSTRLINAKKQINTNIVAIFSDYQFTTDSGIGLGIIPSAIQSNQTILSLVSSQRTAHSSVCFNKLAVRQAGGYVQEDFPAEDISLWLRLSAQGSFASIPKNLLQYRLNKNSISSNRRLQSIQNKNRLLENHKFDTNIVEECVNNIEKTKDFYNEFPMGKQRYFLHLRDLYLISNSTQNKNLKHASFLRKEIIKQVSSYPIASRMFAQTLARKIYRSW